MESHNRQRTEGSQHIEEEELRGHSRRSTADMYQRDVRRSMTKTRKLSVKEDGEKHMIK